MKTVVYLVLASSALASPVVGFAQSTVPLTIVAQGAQQAADMSAPGNQTADSSAQDSQGAAGNAVGGTALSGTSAAGGSARLVKPSSCVGPASYCNTFFGH
jgi:hypothetical protein